MGPRHAGGAAAGNRLAGPADRGDLRPVAGGRALEARVAEITGLRIDPYFTATKLTWLAGNGRPCGPG